MDYFVVALTAFLLIVPVELPDKTFVATLVLSTRYPGLQVWLGVVAAFRIPVQMIPDLEVRTVTVQTRWPGATPQDIEKEIVIEQEEYLRSIPSLERIISQASSGEARIELEFPYNIDLNETLIRINNALSQVPSYPEDVDQPPGTLGAQQLGRVGRRVPGGQYRQVRHGRHGLDGLRQGDVPDEDAGQARSPDAVGIDDVQLAAGRADAPVRESRAAGAAPAVGGKVPPGELVPVAAADHAPAGVAIGGITLWIVHVAGIGVADAVLQRDPDQGVLDNFVLPLGTE